MIITIAKKPIQVVRIPAENTTSVTAATANSLSLGQLIDVDITPVSSGDVLMFDGTRWQADSLDGGEFN